ncbi:MAG: choice-of-anchor Q domain-containing protein, partial [Deinococcota bacterium]
MRTLTATLLLLSATWVVAQVTTNANGGPGSLRAAIAAANSGDTITFDASLSGTTITLTSGALITTLANLTIDASALTNPVTVDANNASQVFFHSGGGTFAINNLEVTGGSVDGGLLSTGGGIRSRGTAVIVTNSTISGNFARDSGGGISSNGDVTLTNSTISGNSAGFIGGGGIFSVGTVTVTNSIVSGNSTNNGDGGGIFSDSGAVTVTNSTISGNNANNGGGGIFSLLAATITNSTISGNSAGAGGGIHGRSNVMVTNSAISGNSATGNGGGIFDLGSTTITNSTISGNSAGSLGGGIATSFNVTLRNSLVLGNDAPNSPQIRTLFSINNNNSAYALTDFSAVTTLADVFTAPEPTASAPTNAGDYTLAACSPAINAGNNAAAPAGNDLAGNARIQNVTVDMGAFESASGTCQTITFDLSTLPVKTVGDADFDISSFASASSGLDVTFSSTTPTVCTTGGTNGATITLVVNGTCTINADQVGNAEYEPAAQVQDSFTVNAAATTIVNKTADTNDGSCDTADCSLREALVNANDGDTITFDASLSGATITLALGQLGTSRNNVTIDASALTNPVTIDANNASRVFIFSDVGTFEINNLVVTNGNANSGGGIYTLGNIIVTNSSITGNLVSNTGGGIFSEGTTTVINSTISGNSAGIQGGG